MEKKLPTMGQLGTSFNSTVAVLEDEDDDDDDDEEEGVSVCPNGTATADPLLRSLA